jgi:hypothetical protein
MLPLKLRLIWSLKWKTLTSLVLMAPPQTDVMDIGTHVPLSSGGYLDAGSAIHFCLGAYQARLIGGDG